MLLSLSFVHYTLFSVFLSLSVATSVFPQTCLYKPPDLRYPPPSVRVPPNGDYHHLSFRKWKPPGVDFIYGTFFVAYSSRRSYQQSLVNMRAEHYPIMPSTARFPAGSEYDVVSFSKCADPKSVTCTDPDAIVTVFGYFTPVGTLGPTDTEPAAVWNYTSTGILNQTTNLYAILAYGRDADGFQYLVQYESGYEAEGTDPLNSRPCINIASRRESGPDQVTMTTILKGLEVIGRTLEDEQFTQVVRDVRPLRSDGRRSHEGPVACDESCVNNEGLVPH